MEISQKNFEWWFILSCIFVAIMFILSMSLVVNSLIIGLFIISITNLLICIYIGT